MKKKNILILGASSRNGMAAAGGLAGLGYKLIGLDEISKSKILQTIRNYTKPVIYDEVVYINYNSKQDIDGFLSALEIVIEENKVDVLLATGTHYTLTVSQYKDRLSRLCLIPVEDFEKMEVLHDKYSAMKLCESLGIPVPKTFLIEDQESLEKIKKEIEFPSVLKARKGASNDGVWIVNDESELQELYVKNILEHKEDNIQASDRSKPIVQEYIPGELHDVTAFSVNGNPKAVLSQVRLMSSPLWGGSGVVNKTTDNEEIKKYAAMIIKKSKWHGILEFDFKIDSRDGSARLIEINPKIWGTTFLTIQAGFNYPLYLVKEVLGESYVVPDEYQVGLSARWPFLEMGTWFEKPVSVKIFFCRVSEFIRMFGDKKMIYDYKLCGLSNTLGHVLIIFLSNSYRFSRFLIRNVKKVRTA